MSKLKVRGVRRPEQLRAEAPTLLLGTRSLTAAAAADDDQQKQDSAGSTGELWLYGVVGGWWRGFNAESVAEALRGLDVDQLFVRLHSPGGHASDGVAIANLLRNHRASVTIVVDGLAASAASVIAVAGDEIVMCPGSQMMLHDASTWLSGNAADLRRAADWIDGQSDNYAGVYAYKAGGTAAQWREVMVANDGHGTWYTAEGAVAAGLATEVGTRVAVSSPPTAPDDDFEDDDSWAKAAHDLQILEHLVPAAARAAWQGENRSAPKPPSASAVGSTHTEGGSAMSLSDQAVTTLRTKLGIAEDADEATILAALDEALDERAEPSGNATAGAGEVVVPEVRLKDLETAAATGVAAAQKLHAMERDAFLDANKAKFPATSRAKWAERYDANPEATRELLASASDLVPTGERGHGDAPEGDESPSVASVREDPTYQNWVI